MKNIDLKGKRALVTGASRGIGKSIALLLAEAGADVAITYGQSIDSAKAVSAAIEGFGGRSLMYQADAADFSAAQAVIDGIVKEWGGIDIVVNNAGITRDTLILRMSEEQWDAVIGTNLKSVFNYGKAAAKAMLRSGGSIINIASIIGITGNAGQTNYAASKAGIIGFSKSLAKELASRNVRVNVVAPGYILTDMTDKLDENALKAIEGAVPMKRGGKAEEVASAVLFLASDLSVYITGAVLQVDGGMAM
jgi:3-oxoacyl-[acyl-carrier protein] reductase